MSTSVARRVAARYDDGHIVVVFTEGVEIRFPVAGNERLAAGTAAQRSRIEVSPHGLHWPDLDEDLSFAGLLAGDYGQERARRCVGGDATEEARV